VGAVMIGVDPHKGSHMVVAIGAAGEPLGELRVRASASQAGRLLAWAQAWPQRTWAVEGAGGVGHLLAQQLLAAGERVADVAPKLGARVRLLASGDTNKNDPDDARSVAVAALRSASCRPVAADDHAAVLKVWSKRHRDLGRTRAQVACRLHAVLCELVPGGVPKEITAAHAAHLLESITPSDAVETARWELAAAFAADLRRTGAQLRETKKKLTVAVAASGTSLTQIFGVGPIVAATVTGGAAPPASRAGTTSPPATAPRRSRCPPGRARSTGFPGAGTGGSTTPSTCPRSPRSGTGTAQAGPTTTGSWRKERPPKKRCGPSNARSATPSSPASRPTPGRPQPTLTARDLAQPYDPGPRPAPRRPLPGNRAEHLMP
jgi:transposase